MTGVGRKLLPEEGFVMDCQALAGNPYDGHTFDTALKRVFLHTCQMPEHLLADRGYRGSEHTVLTQVATGIGDAADGAFLNLPVETNLL